MPSTHWASKTMAGTGLYQNNNTHCGPKQTASLKAVVQKFPMCSLSWNFCCDEGYRFVNFHFHFLFLDPSSFILYLGILESWSFSKRMRIMVTKAKQTWREFKLLSIYLWRCRSSLKQSELSKSILPVITRTSNLISWRLFSAFTLSLCSSSIEVQHALQPSVCIDIYSN